MVILSSESDHVWYFSQVPHMDLTVPIRGLEGQLSISNVWHAPDESDSHREQQSPQRAVDTIITRWAWPVYVFVVEGALLEDMGYKDSFFFF